MTAPAQGWAVVRKHTPEHGQGGGFTVTVYRDLLEAKAAAWDARQDTTLVCFERVEER